MGVLDQLRKQADQKKSSEKQEIDQSKKRDHTYKTEILPKMQEIFQYIQELVEHLNYLEVPIQIEHYSHRFPKLGMLSQKDYKLNTDGYAGFADIDKLMQINMTFYCVRSGSFHYTVKTKTAIEQEVAFFHAKRLKTKILRVPSTGGDEAAKFIVERIIPVRLRFEVDYDQSKIKVMINNHTNFSSYAESWTASQIDAKFLDTLARYILRQDNDFISLGMTNECREQLRKKLARIQKNEEQAFLAMAREQKQHEEQEQQEKLSNKLKAFISDKINR